MYLGGSSVIARDDRSPFDCDAGNIGESTGSADASMMCESLRMDGVCGDDVELEICPFVANGTYLNCGDADASWDDESL